MKRQKFFLFSLFIFLNGCFSEEHLEFNNVPINGSVDKFANDLINLGFAKTELKEENQIILNGVFLEKDCEIYVYGTRKSQTAFKVTVNLPKEVRDSLENSFGKMQKLFSSEYGRGTNRYQQYKNAERFLFNEPKRIRHVRIGDITIYTAKSGKIILEVRDGFISVTYLDNVNNEISKREMKED